MRRKETKIKLVQQARVKINNNFLKSNVRVTR